MEIIMGSGKYINVKIPADLYASAQKALVLRPFPIMLSFFWHFWLNKHTFSVKRIARII